MCLQSKYIFLYKALYYITRATGRNWCVQITESKGSLCLPKRIISVSVIFKEHIFNADFLSKTNLSLEIYNIVLKGWDQGPFSTTEKIIRFGGWRLYPEAHILESHNLGNIISSIWAQKVVK